MALNLPTTLYAGDTISFSDSLDSYNASDGWTLTYSFVNAEAKHSIDSTADGDDFAFAVAKAVTSAWGKGSYKYAATVDNGTDRFTVGTGDVTIRPDLSAGPVDDRNHVEKVLDALEAMLEGKATVDQQSMSIGGRSVARFSPLELLQWRGDYRNQLLALKRAERIANGTGGNGKILTRF